VRSLIEQLTKETKEKGMEVRIMEESKELVQVKENGINY
jgi:hypothetical protein